MVDIAASTYWVTPEDIQADWATMRQSLIELSQGHGGHFLTVYVLSRNGRLVDILEPDYAKIEPARIASSVKSDGINWWVFIRRMISKAAEMNGRGGLIYAHVVLDAQENPVYFSSPIARQMKG